MTEVTPVQDYDALTEADIADVAKLGAAEPVEALPASGPHSADCPHEAVHEHAVTDNEGNRWEGKACADCELVIGQQPTAAVAGVKLSPAVTLKIEDKFGNVVAIGPALSQGLMQEILSRAMGPGRQVAVPKKNPGPELVDFAAQGLDSAPAEHIIVPGKVRGRDF